MFGSLLDVSIDWEEMNATDTFFTLRFTRINYLITTRALLQQSHGSRWQSRGSRAHAADSQQNGSELIIMSFYYLFLDEMSACDLSEI